MKWCEEYPEVKKVDSEALFKKKKNSLRYILEKAAAALKNEKLVTEAETYLLKLRILFYLTMQKSNESHKMHVEWWTN